METGLIASIVGLACTILGAVIGYVAFLRTTKKESEAEGRETGAVLTELGYIKGGIDDLKAENREQRKTNTEFVSRLTAVEASAKQAHHRIDRIEGRDAE